MCKSESEHLLSQIIYSKGNFPYFSFKQGMVSLDGTMFFCKGTIIFIPPCPCLDLSTLASLSSFPTIQILTSPLSIESGVSAVSQCLGGAPCIFFVSASRANLFYVNSKRRLRMYLVFGFPLLRITSRANDILAVVICDVKLLQCTFT